MTDKKDEKALVKPNKICDCCLYMPVTSKNHRTIERDKDSIVIVCEHCYDGIQLWCGFDNYVDQCGYLNSMGNNYCRMSQRDQLYLCHKHCDNMTDNIAEAITVLSSSHALEDELKEYSHDELLMLCGLNYVDNYSHKSIEELYRYFTEEHDGPIRLLPSKVLKKSTNE